jgi:hypothetical protein
LDVPVNDAAKDFDDILIAIHGISEQSRNTSVRSVVTGAEWPPAAVSPSLLRDFPKQGIVDRGRE